MCLDGCAIDEIIGIYVVDAKETGMGSAALPFDLIEVEGLAHKAGAPMGVIEGVAALEFGGVSSDSGSGC